MAPRSHVPAWKRAGLKLKRPPQYSDDLAKVLDSVQPPKKRSKKQHKLDDSPSGDPYSSHLSPIERGGESASSVQADANDAAPDSGAGNGRKSVTFSQDAKLRDGPSQIPTSPLAPTMTSDLSQDVEEGNSTSNAITPSNPPPHPGAKPTSRRYQTIGNKQPYLQYLETYCNNHQYWKFNKNLQSQLLASIYDLDRVPASYDRMLRLYLNRMQGAARWRLKEEAEQILREIEEPEVPSGITTESNGAQPEDGQPSARVQMARKQRRANLIISLFQYRNSDRPTTLPPEQLTMFAQPQANEGKQTQSKRSRGRQRKSAGNATESSSSSSSDSDSDNDQ